MRIDENEVYTTKEVAELLKVSLPTIKRMLADGRLPSTRIGRQHRFLGRDILGILTSQSDLRTAVKSEEINEEINIKTEEPAQEERIEAAPAYLSSDPAPSPSVEFEPRRPSVFAPSQHAAPVDKQRSFMLGKKLRDDVYSNNGELLFARGAIVTDQVIAEAGKHKKLVEVMSNLE
jgi:excisionase family DNA binding protein